jgi:hypothetical protein
MQKITDELTFIVQNFAEKFHDVPEAEFYAKPDPCKWSKIEILGHLIDSAQNNLRRFICVQYESEIPRIAYEQAAWVTANGYHAAKPEDIIHLWRLMNERVISVLNGMNEEHYSKLVNTAQDGVQHQHYSIFALADDYVSHMKHHVNQIICATP